MLVFIHALIALTICSSVPSLVAQAEADVTQHSQSNAAEALGSPGAQSTVENESAGDVEILGEVLFPGQGDRSEWERAGALQDEAVHLAMNEQCDEAVQKANAAIAIYPYDYCFYNTLGIAYQRRGQPGDLKLAEQAFERALKSCSDDPMVWDNIAKIFEEEHELAKAKEAWLKCLVLRPSRQELQQINENIRRCDQELNMH